MAELDYGVTIRLQHEHARDFFESLAHPDIEALRRRDAFFAELDREYPMRTDGTDLIMEIPDIDIEKLLQN